MRRTAPIFCVRVGIENPRHISWICLRFSQPIGHKGAVTQIDVAEREAIMRRFQGATTKEYLNGTSRRSNAERVHKILSPFGLRRFWAYTALRSLGIPQRVFHHSRALSKPQNRQQLGSRGFGQQPLTISAHFIRNNHST